MNKQAFKTRLPAVIWILLCAGLIALVVRALTLKSTAETPKDVIMPVHATEGVLRTAVPATPTPAPTLAPVPASEPASSTSPSYPFWSEGALWIGDSYRSPTLSVDLRVVRDSKTFRKNVVYYVADIHVADVTQIRAEASSGDFKHPRYGEVKRMADRVHALVAISGDYFSCQAGSLVIRNGEVYRKSTRNSDVCLLLKNGEMETLRATRSNMSEILEKDIWQCWDFGPALLDSDGEAILSYPESGIFVGNPRSCIGYVEPGHYIFVVVDGRQRASRGLTLAELAQLMQSLGCVRAYNLDGGASAHFYWKNDVISKPFDGGRSISDIIYIANESYDASPFYFGMKGRSE
jgi:hypothetical protein